MLITRRVLDFGSGSLANAAIFCGDYKFRVIDQRNVTIDDALMWRDKLARKAVAHRPLAAIVLSGRSKVTYGGEEIVASPGEVHVYSDKTALAARQEGPDFRIVVVEWEVEAAGPRFKMNPHSQTHLSHQDLEDVAHAAERISSPVRCTRCAAWGGHILLTVLGRQGLPIAVASARELHGVQTPARELELSQTLDDLLTCDPKRPLFSAGKLQGLTKPISPSDAVASRRIRALLNRYQFNASSWRDLLVRWRVVAGTAAMSIPNARVQDVSRQLGYDDVASFCRMMESHLGVTPAVLARELRARG